MSDKLISADALYASFGASGNCNDCPLDAYKCQYYNEHTLMEFCERIDDAPAVDAVPVVRCKDCKNAQQIDEEVIKINHCVGEWYCDFWAAEMHSDDYCSCGIRRKDGRRKERR